MSKGSPHHHQNRERNVKRASTSSSAPSKRSETSRGRCCCCRPHSTNVLPAESSTRNHVAASSLSPQVARKGSTLSGFVQRSRLERDREGVNIIINAIKTEQNIERASTSCCCCCRPHSTNVLPAESSTRNHVAASSLSPQVARKGSTLSGFVQRSRLEREVGRDLHSNKWEEV